MTGFHGPPPQSIPAEEAPLIDFQDGAVRYKYNKMTCKSQGTQTAEI